MLVQVLRPFEGERPYQPGEHIDTSGWVPGRDQTLIKQRYVTPVTGGGQVDPETAAHRIAQLEQQVEVLTTQLAQRRRRGRPRKSEE